MTFAWSVGKEPIAMFEFTTWDTSFPDFFISIRHYTAIWKQLLFANDRNRVRWVVLGLLQDGASTDLVENFCMNSLKGDLSNVTTFNPPLFSLVNTFKLIFVRMKIMYLRICGSPQKIIAAANRKSVDHKNTWSANRKSANCHICERSANLKKILVPKFADLRFAELICGPLTFAYNLIWAALYSIYKWV